MLRSTRSELRATIANAEAQLEALDRWPEDDFADGAIITFDRHTVGRRLTYVAIKAGGRWWVSSKYVGPMYWHELIEWAGPTVTQVWWASEVLPLFEAEAA